MDIFTALKPENIKVLRKHIAAGTDLETKELNDSTPLLIASMFGNYEAVKLLIAEGANIKAANK